MGQKEIRGVSPVVGTILLIAITVALAAVVATLVSGLGGKGAPPSAMLTVTAEWSGENIVLTVSHEGGDDLVLSDLEVKAGDDTATLYKTTLSRTSGTLSVGDVITATWSSANTTDNVIVVYVIHVPSKQKIFSATNVIVR
jgi:flagellin-like protein